MNTREFFARYMTAPMGSTPVGNARAALTVNGGKDVKITKNPEKQLVIQTSTVSRIEELVDQITPTMVGEAIEEAASGNIGKLQGLYMRMSASDARFRGLQTVLHAGVLANPLRVFPSQSQTPQSKEYEQVAKDLLTMFRHSDILRKLTRSYLTGVSIFEPLWTVSKGSDGKDRVLPYKLELVPPTLYKFDTEEDSPTFGEMMITTADEPDGIPVSEYPWGRLLMTDDGAEKGFYDQAGACRPCLFWFLVKNKNSSFWAEFNELYGEPTRVAYYDEDISDADLTKLESFIKNIGRAAYALLPQGVELDITERVNSGQVKTFEDLINLANTEMSIAIVGQTQTSDGGQYGSYAKANVQMVVLYQIIKMIGVMVKEAFDDLLVSTLVYNFGPDIDHNDLPQIKLVVPNPEEKEVKARVFKMAQELGMEIPKQHAHDELGIPTASDGDEILEPKQQENTSGITTDANGSQRDADAEDDKRSAQREETK